MAADRSANTLSQGANGLVVEAIRPANGHPRLFGVRHPDDTSRFLFPIFKTMKQAKAFCRKQVKS